MSSVCTGVSNKVVYKQYIYLNHQPIAKLEGKQLYAIHSDHLGTPRLVTNDKKETVWKASYSPFGKATVETNRITLNLRLPGQYEDEETGTYYNYLRDYDPETGRYITSDPIGLKGGVNTYAYVEGNPLSNIDPLGLLQLPPPGSPLYKALIKAGLIAAADGPGPEPGPADIAGAAYLAGAIISIAIINPIINYFDRPETDDINYLLEEIQLYKPSYSGSNARTWENHQQLVIDLYSAQYEYVNTSICYIGFGQELYQRAQNALDFRDQLNNLILSPQAFYSPEGIWFQNETFYKAALFSYEGYLENGGNLSFEDWYYETYFKVLTSTITFNRGGRTFYLEQGNASSGWKHIYDRHIDPNRFPNKSKFDKSLSQKDITDLLSETLKHGTKTTYQGLDVFTFRTNFKGTGYRDYRVTVNPDGTIRTFHPLD